MARKRFTDEQIVLIFPEAEGSASIQEVIRKHGTSDQTYYRWRRDYGGMEAAQDLVFVGLDRTRPGFESTLTIGKRVRSASTRRFRELFRSQVICPHQDGSGIPPDYRLVDPPGNGGGADLGASGETSLGRVGGNG